MAITIDQALELTADEQILKDRLIGVIDAELSLNYVEGKSVEIRHALITEAYDQNPRLLESIIGEYTEWRAVIYENKLQGQWLSFSKAIP